MPRNFKRDNLVVASASDNKPCGKTPDLLASLLMLSCKQIFSGDKLVGLYLFSNSAIFKLGTLATQEKFSAISLVLFD